MKRTLLRTLCSSLFVSLAAMSAAGASDAYPAKPVKIVVPYPPGGPYDIIARVVGQKVGEGLGKPFVVENRAGAGGIIGADAVAKSAPDGYTLLVGGIGPNAINASLYPKIPYNVLTDFAPVIEVLRSPNVLVVNQAVKAASVAELIGLARASGSKMSYASAGAGSSTHLFAEMFKQAAKVEMVQIPYRGDMPAVTATLAGETPIYFASAASIMPHIKSGRLRALAVTGRQRLPALPTVPTMSEAGVANYHATAWYGIFAPAGTPKDIVQALNKQFNLVLEDPEVRKKLIGEGSAEIIGGTPEAFASVVQSETAKWKEVVQSGNISAD